MDQQSVHFVKITFFLLQEIQSLGNDSLNTVGS